MKTIWYGLLLVALVSVSSFSGCSKKTIAVDTTKLDYSFQAADEGTKTTVNEAIEAIENADYSSALEKLKKVQADPKLTAEQKSDVGSVVTQLEQR